MNNQNTTPSYSPAASRQQFHVTRGHFIWSFRVEREKCSVDGCQRRLQKSLRGMCWSCRKKANAAGDRIRTPHSVIIKFIETTLNGARAGNNDCVIWPFGQSPDGYGKWKHKGRTSRAHRVLFDLFHGSELPSSTIIRHSCHTPLCCNPNHLLQGTPADNARDMVVSGRSLAGEKNHNASMSNESAISVLLKYDSNRSVAKTALMCGIARETCSGIIIGHTYASISVPFYTNNPNLVPHSSWIARHRGDA